MTEWSVHMYKTLDVEIAGPVGRLWLNRPERLNALSVQVLQELETAARWFDGQGEVRVVIVGARGRAFSAGADLEGFPSLDEAGLREAADIGLGRYPAAGARDGPGIDQGAGDYLPRVRAR